PQVSHLPLSVSLPLSHLFLTAPATTDSSTLSLHDALPISFAFHGQRNARPDPAHRPAGWDPDPGDRTGADEPESPGRPVAHRPRSEEHTSELQSLTNLVCRLLLEKKKKTTQSRVTHAKQNG